MTRQFVAGIVLHFAALPVLAQTLPADPRNTSGPVAATVDTTVPPAVEPGTGVAATVDTTMPTQREPGTGVSRGLA